MTADRNLKRIIRDRQQKTGESYTAARAQVLGSTPRPPVMLTTPVTGSRRDAVVLKVNRQSVRIRFPGEDGQLTVRSGDQWRVVPGHIVTVTIEAQWTWRGDAYASGEIEDPRLDVARLGLEPLPLLGGEVYDLREDSEPYRRPDPYAPVWRRRTARPLVSFEFDPIAWGAFPGDDPEENLTCDAAELSEAGDVDGARELLMTALLRDLRCTDAHAHLGYLEFPRSPAMALLHYEVGVAIAELSLPPGFDGVLEWGRIYNRPFLRALNGQALCLWRMGQFDRARTVFERILALNPNDNQGVRFCWEDVRRGLGWEVAR